MKYITDEEEWAFWDGHLNGVAWAFAIIGMFEAIRSKHTYLCRGCDCYFLGDGRRSQCGVCT
jgi:hypothetical protein